MSARKQKRAPRAGEGRPRRTSDGPAATMSLRLSPAERTRLRALAAKWRCSESDAARRAIEMAANIFREEE